MSEEQGDRFEEQLAGERDDAERDAARERIEHLEALLRAGDAALEAAGVPNDGSAIATRIGVLGERCTMADREVVRLAAVLNDWRERADRFERRLEERTDRFERRLEERTAERDEAWKELQARDRELADAKAAFERERTELFQERAVILRLKKDREDARRERDAAQAESRPVHGDGEVCPSCSAIFGRPSPCAMTHEFGPPHAKEAAPEVLCEGCDKPSCECPDDEIASGPDPLERLELQTSDLLDRVARLEAAKEKASFQRIGEEAADKALWHERVKDLETDIRNLFSAVQIAQAAKPSRPKVGRWTVDENGDLLWWCDRGENVGRVSEGASGEWLVFASRPFLAPLHDRAPTCEGATSKVLAALRTWADVEGE